MPAARDAPTPHDSPFRRRWRLRDRVVVAVAAWGITVLALSWHRDGEIAAQVVRRFGVAVTRGSATRGWLGAVRGLLAANARGEDLVVIPDGPKGPRHEAKQGVVQLARATGLPVVAIGLASMPGRLLRTWDRLQVPRPFGRVALVLGAPVAIGRDGDPLAAVQRALEEAAAVARAALERRRE